MRRLPGERTENAASFSSPWIFRQLKQPLGLILAQARQPQEKDSQLDLGLR